MRGQRSWDRAEGMGSMEKHTERPTNPIPSTPHRGRRKRGQPWGANVYPIPMPPLDIAGTKQRSQP